MGRCWGLLLAWSVWWVEEYWEVLLREEKVGVVEEGAAVECSSAGGEVSGGEGLVARCLLGEVG